MRIDRVWTSLLEIRNRAAAEDPFLAATHCEPSSAIRLSPKVTLIRGDNGSGKTVVAEVISLVGHLPVFSQRPTTNRQGTPFATLELHLSKNDVAFLEWLREFRDSSPKGSVLMGDREWRLSEFAENLMRSAFDDFPKNFDLPEAEEKFFIEFWREKSNQENEAGLPPKTHFDIKKLLASDHLLKQNISFRALDSNGKSFATALQHLIAWSRPKLTGASPEDGPWSITPRFILAQSLLVKGERLDADVRDHFKSVHPPGPVGYVNTDMYDFGVGLDIRESPKELRDHMTRTIVDRLQVLDNIGEIAEGPPSSWIKNTEFTFPIMRLSQVYAGWEQLFGTNHELKTPKAYSRGGDLHWCEEDYLQEFVSSGENQAFFLLCYLENLQWKDSITLLDEPEIHLSIRAASRLIEKIIDYAHRRDAQIVVVTHLPHLFYRAAAGQHEYDLIYLERVGGRAKQVNVLEGEEAFKAASIASHEEAHSVVEDLRTAEAPNIFFWREGLRRWSSWVILTSLVLLYAFLSKNDNSSRTLAAILSPRELVVTSEYVIASMLMGLGIAIDVAIATVARFRDNTMGFTSWTLPVALTHILLPAIGYYGWWFLSQEFHELALVLGLIAFGMIAVFIYGAICEWIDAKPLLTFEPITKSLFKPFDAVSKGRLIIILAVSMDALWSGPAKAAQAQSGQWSPFEVFVSFFIAGGVVALVAEIALLCAFKLRHISFSNNNRLALYLVGGKYIEATILFAFGLLSLWNAFAFWIGLGTLSLCIAGSAAFMLAIWVFFWRRLVREQMAELEEVEAET